MATLREESESGSELPSFGEQITSMFELQNIGEKLSMELAKLDGQLPKRTLSISEGYFILIATLLYGADNILEKLQNLGKDNTELSQGQIFSNYLDKNRIIHIEGDYSFTDYNRTYLRVKHGRELNQPEGMYRISYMIQRTTTETDKDAYGRKKFSGTEGHGYFSPSDLVPDMGWGKRIYLRIYGDPTSI